MNGAMVHIAATPVRVGRLLRQRCGWCGALILSHDLTCLAFLEDDAGDETPRTWPVGELVEVDGAVSFVVARDGDDHALPPAACALLDPAVTA